MSGQSRQVQSNCKFAGLLMRAINITQDFLVFYSHQSRLASLAFLSYPGLRVSKQATILVYIQCTHNFTLSGFTTLLSHCT